MSPNVLRLLKYFVHFRHCGWLHYTARDANAIRRLADLELIERDNENKRARLVPSFNQQQTTTDALLTSMTSCQEWEDDISSLLRYCQNVTSNDERVINQTWTEKEAFRYILADKIKDYTETLIDDLSCDTTEQIAVYTLVRSAFCDLDFHQIAQWYINRSEEEDKQNA